MTLARLRKFTLNAIQRLSLDNPKDVFTPVITDHYTDLFGTIANADAGTTQRRTQAQQMWGALEGLQDKLEDDKDLADYKSKKNPAIRADFFLNGRSTPGPPCSPPTCCSTAPPRPPPPTPPPWARISAPPGTRPSTRPFRMPAAEPGPVTSSTTRPALPPPTAKTSPCASPTR